MNDFSGCELIFGRITDIHWDIESLSGHDRNVFHSEWVFCAWANGAENA